MLIQRIGTHDLPPPARQKEGDAGYDLQYAGYPVMTLQPGQRLALPTGFAWKVKPGYVGRVSPRSGLAYHEGVDILAGVVDGGFTGEVMAILQNHGDRPVTIRHGDRIAQMVVTAICTDDLVLVGELPATQRGADGFGSTGVHIHTNQGASQ